MYSATLSDCGLNYSAVSMKDITKALNQYLTEEFGVYKVVNLKKDSRYKDFSVVSSPGEYLIEVKNKTISCKIDAI